MDAVTGLMEVYQKRRDDASKAQMARRREAFAAVPALFENDERYRLAQRKRAERIKNGETPDTAEIDAASRERAELLTANGYPADYLELKYTCPICRDSGYTGDAPCACLTQLRFERSTAQSNLSRLAKENFNTWDLSRIPEENGQRASSEKLKTELQAYAMSFPNVEKPNLFLMGSTGVGKSFAAHCVGNAMKARMCSVRKYTAPQFFRMVMESIVKEREYGAIDELESTDLLILDDLGSEPKVSDISETTLYSLIDERTMAGRATIITTNMGINALLERYGDRAVSRLTDERTTQLIRMRGRDLRMLPPAR